MRIVSWDYLKKYIVYKGDLQYIELEDRYILKLFVNNEYFCCILKKNDIDDLGKIDEFESIYKADSNKYPSLHFGSAVYENKYMYLKGYSFIAEGGNSSKEIKIEEDVLLNGGEIFISGRINDLDYINVYVRDKDNILGFGDIILYRIVENIYLVASKDNNDNVLNSIFRFKIDSGNLVFNLKSGLYLCVDYYNNSNSNKNVTFYIKYWK